MTNKMDNNLDKVIEKLKIHIKRTKQNSDKPILACYLASLANLEVYRLIVS